MCTFKHALVRPPGKTFADGLTSSGLPRPSYAEALDQHASYCAALQRCGLEVTSLPASDEFPDAQFVEDVAVIAAGAAIITRPGAPSRRGEVELVRAALTERFADVEEIAQPGTLDGGDVCEAGKHVYIGISQRTNADGAAQLTRWLSARDRTASTIDIRPIGSLLHLTSGLTYVGDDTIVAIGALADHPGLHPHRIVRVPPEESHAANCVRLNDRVLIAAGYPRVAMALEGLGYRLERIDNSEFRAMDGALSCLSLRY